MEIREAIKTALNEYLEEWSEASPNRRFEIMTALASNFLYIEEMVKRCLT